MRAWVHFCLYSRCYLLPSLVFSLLFPFLKRNSGSQCIALYRCLRQTILCTHRAVHGLQVQFHPKTTLESATSCSQRSAAHLSPCREVLKSLPTGSGPIWPQIKKAEHYLETPQWLRYLLEIYTGKNNLFVRQTWKCCGSQRANLCLLSRTQLCFTAKSIRGLPVITSLAWNPG